MARRTRSFTVAFLLLAAAGGAVLYLLLRPAPTASVSLRFHALLGDDVLQLDQGVYDNPGGEGVFSIRDFQFFVSNVRLVAEDRVFRDAESYHLIRFDGEDGTYVLDLTEVPRDEYTRIEFGIGVDSIANGSNAPVGDLDPNGRMAWGWEIGYKFVLVEGGLDLGDTRLPLVYHIGFDENYRQVSIPIEPPRLAEGTAVDLCADLLRMFTADRTVDMSQMSNVTTERAASRLLADNYARMVSPCLEPSIAMR